MNMFGIKGNYKGLYNRLFFDSGYVFSDDFFCNCFLSLYRHFHIGNRRRIECRLKIGRRNGTVSEKEENKKNRVNSKLNRIGSGEYHRKDEFFRKFYPSQ